MTSADKRSIRRLQLLYADAFDARDADAFAALYTVDAEIEQHDGRIFSGHEKLRKAVRNMPLRGDGFHRIGEASITVSGDQAYARCDYVARTADGRYAKGHYEDRYLRAADGWHIARRKVCVDRWLDQSHAEVTMLADPAASQGDNMYRSSPSETPTLFIGRLIGRIEGCTNPESAELLLDGETFVFGNCALMVGHPAYRQGKGIVYLQAKAFISRAQILSSTDVELLDRIFIGGLTATLGCDVLPRATRRFPAGTVFINEGANPVSQPGDTHIVDRSLTTPRILAFDPSDGSILGEVPLGPESDWARRFNGIDQPNGLAISKSGDIYVGDIPNGNPVAQLPPPVPAAIYRIPHEALDLIASGAAGAADAVERIETPGFINGLTMSKDDDACWAVSCSQHDPVKGGIYRLTPGDFAAGRQPVPVLQGLGIIDGIAVTRRGTILASTPISGEIHAFAIGGTHQVVRLADESKTVRMPADFNVCYPSVLGGEPALLVTDISVGKPEGDASVAVVDITGL